MVCPAGACPPTAALGGKRGDLAREVARRARARGAPLSDAQAARLLATLRADPDLLRPGARRRQLLDVGSCSSMFEGQVS